MKCWRAALELMQLRIHMLALEQDAMLEHAKARTWDTIFWKSAMPCASMRIRSASCVSAGSINLYRQRRNLARKPEPHASKGITSVPATSCAACAGTDILH